jgi:hypothetical protein
VAVDPSGLLAPKAAEGSDPDFQNDLESALKEMRSTPSGKALWDEACASDDTYTIQKSNIPNDDCEAPTVQQSRKGDHYTINWDKRMSWTVLGQDEKTGKYVKTAIDGTVALVHELGHPVLCTTDVGDHGLQNVIASENPYRHDKGLPLRIEYYSWNQAQWNQFKSDHPGQCNW